MTVSGDFYNSARKKLLEGGFNLATDTLKLALCNASYTPDVDNHDFFDDITNEVTGTGYTTGGLTVAGKTTNVDNTNNRGYFDATDPLWSTLTTTARYAILYKSTGTPSTSPLICYIDFGANVAPSAENLSLILDPTGLVRL